MNLSELIYYKDNYNKLNNIRKQRNEIIPFVGAGISIQCGLYSWMGMLDMIAKDFFTDNEIQNLHSSCNCYEYADKIVEVAGNEHMIMSKIRDLFNNTVKSFTESPYILTSSFSNLIITTNYDTILEDASRQNIKSTPLKPLLPFLEEQMDAAIQNNNRCLLKLHGSVEETSSFVLTSSQYKKFYGTCSTRKDKPLVRYLNKIFVAKKLLFVGCSLENDKILDILCECVEREQNISHYAIVPWIEDETKRIQRNRQLTKLGIEPIYFPKNDYDSVRKLLQYLARDNLFTQKIESYINDIVDETTASTICSITREAFFDVANAFPKLLDEIHSPSLIEYENSLKERSLSESDTIYSVLISAFNDYIDCCCFCEKEKIKNYFSKIFADLCLKKRSIDEFLKKQWSINNNLNHSDIDTSWLIHLSSEDIENFACDLLQKLQYTNGMSFADISPMYTLSKELIECAEERISYHVRTRLLNSIGAFSYYFNESKKGAKYLEKAISLVEKKAQNDKNELLFLSKCFYNLALAYANIGDLNKSLDAITSDIEIKKEYMEDSSLYARSLDLYSTILKVIYPFKAGNIYLEVAKRKEELAKLSYDDIKMQNDALASWATVLFNIGLLCRDVGLYDNAYEYIVLANNIRFKTLESCNRDFCSSLNVQAELELILHKTDEPSQIVSIIENKQNLPKNFDKIMGHTYYICALYYYVKKDYSNSYMYSQCSLDELNKDNSSDFIQIVKSNLILALSLQYINIAGNGQRYVSSGEIIGKTVNDIKKLLGNESLYLIYPYRAFTMCPEFETEKDFYFKEIYHIQQKYSKEKSEMKSSLNEYFQKINK